jgi:hypothetical protein
MVVVVVMVVMVGLWGHTGIKVKAGFGIGRIEKVRKRVCVDRGNQKWMVCSANKGPLPAQQSMLGPAELEIQEREGVKGTHLAYWGCPCVPTCLLHAYVGRIFCPP